VFTRDGTTWTERAKLIASDALSGDRFATSVDISGDVVAVGSPNRRLSFQDVGGAYVIPPGVRWACPEHC